MKSKNYTPGLEETLKLEIAKKAVKLIETIKEKSKARKLEVDLDSVGICRKLRHTLKNPAKSGRTISTEKLYLLEAIAAVVVNCHSVPDERQINQIYPEKKHLLMPYLSVFEHLSTVIQESAKTETPKNLEAGKEVKVNRNPFAKK